MTWLFAFVVVAVMGVVAIVSTGRGGALGEVFDDRPDASIPAKETLSGADIKRVRFTTAFRGYRMSEVDALLARLAAQIEHGHQAPEDPRP